MRAQVAATGRLQRGRPAAGSQASPCARHSPLAVTPPCWKVGFTKLAVRAVAAGSAGAAALRRRYHCGQAGRGQEWERDGRGS